MADGFGTIFRMRVKPGAEQRVVQLMDQWDRERRPKIRGVVGTFLFRPVNRSDELIGVAVFRDREAYRANANDPEQDAWYRQLREQLESDPEWEDGAVLGGSAEG